jgi:tRNA(Ile2) C34 agmatinyltransferase TiaS
MNTPTIHKLLLATVMTALISSTGLAGLPAFPHMPDFSTYIRQREQAAKLPVGTKVALACKTCQAHNIRTVDEKKTFLAWFDVKATQKCDGCGGQMKLKRAPGTSGYTHVCSKCGDNSAAVCAAPMKKGNS